MSKNVDVVAVCLLLLAAAVIGGVKQIVASGHFGPSRLIRVERNGSSIYVDPVLPPIPPLPPLSPLPRIQRN